MNNQDFGKFISTLRKEKGLTQKELADKLNLTDKAVSRWENGRSYPDVELFEPIADLLSVSINELIACKRMENEKEAELETAKAYPGNVRTIKTSKRFSAIILACVTFIAKNI